MNNKWDVTRTNGRLGYKNVDDQVHPTIKESKATFYHKLNVNNDV